MCSERRLKDCSKGKWAYHGKSAEWPELEADLWNWVEGHCLNNIAVTTKVAHDHNIEDFQVEQLGVATL